MDLHHRITILLVEDDESACEIIGSMLAISFPQVLVYRAGDGQAGLDSFRLYQQDIVITDINMPEMDGVQLIGNIFALKADTRFIVVTAHSDRKSIEKITSTGVDSTFVPKPINFEALFASITENIASLS